MQDFNTELKLNTILNRKIKYKEQEYKGPSTNVGKVNRFMINDRYYRRNDEQQKITDI